MFTVAVFINRKELDRRIVLIGKALIPFAIGRRRRRINKWHPIDGAPIKQPHRKAKIGFNHQIAVGGGGLRNRAEVDDAVELAAL